MLEPIQFYSCFISYNSKNQPFAERLYEDLRGKGVTCYYAPKDLRIGEKIRVGLDEKIRDHDKLLLVLSKYSVASDWVEKEVETAMEMERQQKRVVLFPIRLDDAVMKIETGVIAPVPGIMRLFWAFSSSNPPESPSQEDSSLANMLDTLEARCRSDGPPAGPRSIDPLPGSRSFLTVSAVA